MFTSNRLLGNSFKAPLFGGTLNAVGGRTVFALCLVVLFVDLVALGPFVINYTLLPLLTFVKLGTIGGQSLGSTLRDIVGLSIFSTKLVQNLFLPLGSPGRPPPRGIVDRTGG